MPVYFIQNGKNGHIKIGYTGGNPFARLDALQTGNPIRLIMLGAIKGTAQHEREIHARFAQFRETGEWFKPEPPLVNFILGALYAGGIALDSSDRSDPPGALLGLTAEQVLAIQIHMTAEYSLLTAAELLKSSSPTMVQLLDAELSLCTVLDAVESDSAGVCAGAQHNNAQARAEQLLEEVRERLSRVGVQTIETIASEELNDGEDPTKRDVEDLRYAEDYPDDNDDWESFAPNQSQELN